MKYLKLFILSLALLAGSAPARAGGTWNWGREAPAPKPVPTDWWALLWPFKF